MWYLLIALASLAGEPIGLSAFDQTFDTKDACVSAAPAMIDEANKHFAERGQTIAADACISHDDMEKIKAKFQGKENDNDSI